MLFNDKIDLSRYSSFEKENYTRWLAFKSSLFLIPSDRVLWFFKNLEINYFSYFKKNKSVFREPETRFKSIRNSILKGGGSEAPKNLFLKVFYNNFTSKHSNLFSSPVSLLFTKSLVKFNKLDFYKFVDLFFSLNVYFKFSFHMLNKKIRKFSRGKSGKYKSVYNYIPFFKREKFKTKQFRKNLKLIEGRNFYLRLSKLTDIYKNDFKSTVLFYEKNKAIHKVFTQKYNTIMLKSF